MQNKNIITFIKKIGVFLLPVFALIIWYLNSDPFKVIHTYRTYSNQPIDLNQGYISWQSYLNHKDSLKYDSFIFGNSCTMAYPTTLWKNYLQGASAIRLNGNSESLYAIHKKIKRLDELGVPIKNILLLLDHNTLRKLAKPIPIPVFCIQMSVILNKLNSKRNLWRLSSILSFLYPMSIIWSLVNLETT